MMATAEAMAISTTWLFSLEIEKAGRDKQRNKETQKDQLTGSEYTKQENKERKYC